jgi:hypothetical protein
MDFIKELRNLLNLIDNDKAWLVAGGLDLFSKQPWPSLETKVLIASEKVIVKLLVVRKGFTDETRLAHLTRAKQEKTFIFR